MGAGSLAGSRVEAQPPNATAKMSSTASRTGLREEAPISALRWDVCRYGLNVHSTPLPAGSTFSTCMRRPIMDGLPSKMLGPVPPTSTGAM